MRATTLFFALAMALYMAAPASAQQRQAAPITFAGQGGVQPVVMASIAPSLAGGDENSYGYGGAPRAQGAVIDIRQNARPQSAQVQRAPVQVAPNSQAEQGAPAWVERERVGPPYEANGRWYVPTAEPGYEQTGVASWYGPQFHGQATASGEVFDQDALTAAHPTLPIPSLVQVTNLENGREAIVRVNDRGPFVGERLIDLSRRSAEVLGFQQQGQARVHVRYLGPAPRRFNEDGSPPPAQSAPQTETMNPALSAPAAFETAQNDGPMSLTPPRAAPVEQFETPAPPPAPVYAAAPAVAASGGYFVQIGAFSDMSNAHRVRERVSAAGPVNVDTRQTAAGELFRVRMGPFPSRGEAEAARMQVADLGYREAVLASR